MSKSQTNKPTHARVATPPKMSSASAVQGMLFDLNLSRWRLRAFVLFSGLGTLPESDMHQFGPLRVLVCVILRHAGRNYTNSARIVPHRARALKLRVIGNQRRAIDCMEEHPQ
jgi:hypothetical protein